MCVLLSETIEENNYDIFTMAESWSGSSASVVEIDIPGYLLFRQDPETHRSGGELLASIFDDFDDAGKRIKTKSKPDPFMTVGIRQLRKTRDTWHTRGIKTKDELQLECISVLQT